MTIESMHSTFVNSEEPDFSLSACHVTYIVKKQTTLRFSMYFILKIINKAVFRFLL